MIVDFFIDRVKTKKTIMKFLFKNSSTKSSILLLASFSSQAYSRYIEFFLYNQADLDTVRSDCFELSTTNQHIEFITIDVDKLYYSLEIPGNFIPNNLEEIISECPRLQRTFAIGEAKETAVLTRSVITELDKILLPICLIVCAIIGGLMVYYKHFSKYKNIVELDSESDFGSVDRPSNPTKDSKYYEDDGKSNVTFKSRVSATSKCLDNIQRNDSVIPGKIKSIGLFANQVNPDIQVTDAEFENNFHPNNEPTTNITVNIGEAVSPSGSRKAIAQTPSGVNLY